MKSRILVQTGCVLLLGIALAAGAKHYENKDVANGVIQTSADGESGTATSQKEVVADTTTYVFLTSDLEDIMEPILTQYQKDHKTEKLKVTTDTSDNLLKRLESGENCDLIITKDSKKLQKMEDAEVLEKNTLRTLFSDQLTIITGTDNEICKVINLESLKEADTISYEKGTPGIRSYLKKAKKAGTELVSCGSAEEVFSSVEDGKSEVGIVEFSSTYGYEDQIRIVANVSAEEVPVISYVAAQAENASATTAEKVSAENFLQYIRSGEAEEIYEAHYYTLAE